MLFCNAIFDVMTSNPLGFSKGVKVIQLTAQNFMNNLIRCEEVQQEHLDGAFPERSQKNDKSAAKFLLGISVETINAAWLARDKASERKREPTLQALQSAVKSFLSKKPGAA